MKRIRMVITGFFIIALNILPVAAHATENEALDVLDVYLDAFNQRDVQAWRAVHHVPYLSVDAQGTLAKYSFKFNIPPLFLSPEIDAADWETAEWESIEMGQSSDDKVHVMTRLTLYRADGSAIQSHDALYVLALENEWGISAVSTFDPVDSPSGPIDPDLLSSSEEIAFDVLDTFMETFNAEDYDAHLDTHNFPHFRIANGNLRITDGESLLSNGTLYFLLMKASTGFQWDHSVWNERSVCQFSDSKIHVQTNYSRYTEDNEYIEDCNSLYVLTLQDGKWGVKGRSSFAPH